MTPSLSMSAYLFCASEFFSLTTFPVHMSFPFFFLHLDKFGSARFLYQSQCRDVCPEAFFHSSRKRCEPCPADCIICSSAYHCLHCSPGHQLRSGQCLPLECSAGKRCWWRHIRLFYMHNVTMENTLCLFCSRDAEQVGQHFE